MNNLSLFYGIITAAVATYITRAIPFWLFDKKKPNIHLQFIEKYMPLQIMIILVFYSIRETSFSTYPYGIGECLGIIIAIFMHLIFKNTLLSIFSGTISYMILIQNFL